MLFGVIWENVEFYIQLRKLCHLSLKKLTKVLVAALTGHPSHGWDKKNMERPINIKSLTILLIFLNGIPTIVRKVIEKTKRK